MRMRMIAVAAASLLVVACGGDGGDDATSAHAEALGDAIAEGDGLPLARSEIDCLASVVVDALGGPESLGDAGVTPDELREAESIAELGIDRSELDLAAAEDIFDVCEISLAEIALSASEREVPEELRECVARALDNEVVARALIGAVIAGQQITVDELPASAQELLLGCAASPGTSG